MAEHGVATEYEIDWEDVEIIEAEENRQRRKIKGLWNIRMKKPKFNRNEGTLEEL